MLITHKEKSRQLTEGNWASDQSYHRQERDRPDEARWPFCVRHWDTHRTSAVCLPKMRNLNLSTSTQQTNPHWGTQSKVPGQDSWKAWRRKEGPQDDSRVTATENLMTKGHVWSWIGSWVRKAHRIIGEIWMRAVDQVRALSEDQGKEVSYVSQGYPREYYVRKESIFWFEIYF